MTSVTAHIVNYDIDTNPIEVTKYDNVRDCPFSYLTIYNNAVPNKYQFITPDGIEYTISLTCKRYDDSNIIKTLFYMSSTTKIHINFYYDQLDKYEVIYRHWINEVMPNVNNKYHGRMFSDNYILEKFKGYEPTRMFFDLDFKDPNLDTRQYISDIVTELTNLTILKQSGKQLSYVVTKNDIPESYSRHVIFMNLNVPNIEVCKYLANNLKDKFNYIDTNPYSSVGSLRTLGARKDNKYKIIDYCVNYDIPPNEPLLIQPGTLEVIDFNTNFTPLDNIEDDCIEDVDISNINLSQYGLVLGPKVKNNIYNCTKSDLSIDCPICKRIHDKNDTNYIVASVSGNINLKCHRNRDESITIGKSEHWLKSFINNYKPINYNNLYKFVKHHSTYENEFALMPDTIQGNCLYLSSPCKTGKTNALYTFLESLHPDTSICFITCQRLFTTDIYNRFKSLGFESYLEKEYNRNHNRIVVSINSLVKTSEDKTVGGVSAPFKYDYCIIDEVESLHSCFSQYMTNLGNHEVNLKNVDKFNNIVSKAGTLILMDAYPTIMTMKLFNKHGRSIHFHHNTYKTHQDDIIKFVGEPQYLVYKMASSLARGENIVFASSLKKKQHLMLEQLYKVLKECYNIDPNELSQLFYSSDCDADKMDKSIENIKSSWYVNLLCYTPCINAGISFTARNFDKVFYLGNPSIGHISMLQALYRVRDISTRKYYIGFGMYHVPKEILKMNERFKQLLNFNCTYTFTGRSIEIADNLHNYTMNSSAEYYNKSVRDFYKSIIGQFKYNGSTIKTKYIDTDEYKKKRDNDDNLPDYRPYYNPFNLNPTEKDNKTIKYGDAYDVIKNNKREIRQLTNINEYLKPYINTIPLREEHFNILNAAEFKDLDGKNNKSNLEKDIILINKCISWFPKFAQLNNLDNKRKYFIDIKKKLSTYFSYYNCYRYKNTYIEDGINWENRNNHNYVDNNPEYRFKIKIASTLLSFLLGETETRLNNSDYYIHLHDAQYRDINITTLQNAFTYILNNSAINIADGTDPQERFKKLFYVEYYTNVQSPDDEDTYPYPNAYTDWKKMNVILKKILEPTYNLTPVTYNKINRKINSISLLRPLSLF